MRRRETRVALKTVLELMHCGDQRIRTRATALWRIYGPQMVRDLERLRLRADRLAETPKARHRERNKRPREAS